MEINSKLRAKLRAYGNGVDPLVRVGKEGLTETVIASLDDVLRTREIAKVKVLKNSDEDIKEIAKEMAEKSGAELIHVMGRTILLFRVNKEKPVISNRLEEL
jgi:RNA-binding protein